MNKAINIPLAVIDYEASGLIGETYPIEVGIALTTDGITIHSASSLIRPTWEWEQYGVWNERAEKIHNIRRRDLETAPPPEEAARAMMSLLKEHGLSTIPLHCDGGEFDEKWHAAMTKASGVKLPRLTGIDQYKNINFEQYRIDHNQSQAVHRAEADARWLLQYLLDRRG